jgi:hypothetical protein
MTHYQWPELGEQISHLHLSGKVVSRHEEELFFTIHADGGDYYNIDLVDFIVDQIRNGS